MKNKIIDSFGSFGIIIWFLFLLFKNMLPAVMIADSILIAIGIAVVQEMIPFTSIVFWVWGLVCAITGKQDFFAFVYYIMFAVLFLPFILKTASNFLIGK